MTIKRLAHYDIIGPIGAGGMGEVYRARDTKLGRDVAIKLLPEAFARDADRLARFEREARLLASLNHPHVASIYGLEEDGAHRFLVLELVEGEDLAKRIARGPLPADEALAIAEQVCEALEAAHEAGVIHRDLKPGNIVLGENDAVKVLDFGLAKALDPATNASNLSHSPTLLGSSPTMHGVILGTAAYMSPEQARGKTVDRRADIFAFGCVLYEMLTGRQLFSGETVSDTLAAVLRADVDWDALPKDTPRAIRHLLARCLEKDPRRRLRDIGEATLVLGDLRSGRLSDEPAAVGAPSLPKRRFMGTRGVAVAVVLLAAVAAASSAVTRMLAPKPAEEPFRKFMLDVGMPDSLGTSESPRLSPDGRRIAFFCGGSVWVRDFESLESRRLAEASPDVAPFWSPDGAQIGYATSKRLWKIRADGGDPQPICDSPASFGGGSGASWGDDGRVVFSYGNGGIWAAPVSGGDAQEIIPVDPDTEQDIHQPVALPRGAGILFISHRRATGPDTIVLFANDKRETLMQFQGQNLWSIAYSSSGHLLFVRIPDNGGLWAVPFSVEQLALTGEPFLVAPKSSEGSVAQGDLLAYQPSITGQLGHLTWITETGAIVPTGLESMSSINSLALAPDGTKIAVSMREATTRDLWVIDITRGTRIRLTFTGNYNAMPSWSPDGRVIAYRNNDEESVHIVPSDGTGKPRFVADHGAFPTFSPDGRWLLYNSRGSGSNQGGDADIFMLDLSSPDTTRVLLLGGTGNQRSQDVSPDGRYVVYVSDEAGTSRVFLTTFPEATGKWQVSVAGDARWPRWSPSGERIYFISDDRLEYVTVEAGATPRLGAPQLVVNLARGRIEEWGFQKLDVAADGRVIMVGMSRDFDVPRGFVIVENWLHEFDDSR